MSEYFGSSRSVRVKIIATKGWLAKYNNQECEVVLYDPGVSPHINTEMLNPPLPKWQTARFANAAVSCISKSASGD